MLRFTIALMAALVTISFDSAKADIFFTISPDDADVTAGSSGTLTFGVAATGADTGQEVDSYRIGFTTSAFGGANIDDITFSAPISLDPIANGFTANSNADGTFVFASLNDGTSPPTIGSQLDFFTVDYSIAATAGSTGGFNIDITNIAGGAPAADVIIARNGSNIATDSVEGVIEGRLNLVAVPEPSSAIAIVALSGLFAVRRRRIC